MSDPETVADRETLFYLQWHARRWLELELEIEMRVARIESLQQQRRHERIAWWCSAVAGMASGAAAMAQWWLLPFAVLWIWMCRRADQRQLEIEDELDELVSVPRAQLVDQTDSVRSSHVGQNSS